MLQFLFNNMRIKRLFLFAGVAIAAASLFASCDPQDKIEGQEEQPFELKEGTVREHSFSRGEPSPLSLELSTDESRLFHQSDSFAIKLFMAVNESMGDQNFCISPLSLQVTLGLLANGMDDAGYAELSEALYGEVVDKAFLNNSLSKLKNALEQTNCVKISNGIWLSEDSEFKAGYLDVAQQKYGAATGYLDFKSHTQSAYDSICQWAYDNTCGKLNKQVIDYYGPGTAMVLANSAWFSSIWDYPFKTREDNRMGSTSLAYYVYNGYYELLSLPFRNLSFRMDFVFSSNNTPIDEIISNLSCYDTNDLVYSKILHTNLPKFSVDNDIKLGSILENLGVSELFKTWALPNIGNHMYSNRYLNQSIRFDVVEGGIDAEADPREFPEQTPGYVIIDNWPTALVEPPFIYAIRDNVSGAFLFMGKVCSLD